MTSIIENALQEISEKFTEKLQNNGLFPWQYPIKRQVNNEYEYKIAQKLLEFSYKVPVHNKQAEEGLPDVVKLNPPRFNVVIPLNTTIRSMPANVLWFFYSKKMNIVVLSFTGTYNKATWLVDFDYIQKNPVEINNYTNGMKIHGGFWDFYLSIQNELLDLLSKYVDCKTQILITGISLGGAMSSICALDLYKRKLSNCVKLNNNVHYSFESPRVFNNVAQQKYDSLNMSTYRIINGSDIVPVVPFPIMPPDSETFTHVSTQIYFNTNMGNYFDNHVTACLNKYKVRTII